MSKRKFQTGFTLVELMVTLAVAGIVVSLATPSFNEMIANSRLTSAANELVGALSYARSEAVKRGVNVTVLRKSPNAGVWESGWVVYVEADGDNEYIDAVATQCAPNQDCLLRTYDALPNGYTLRTGASGYDTRATYLPSGFPDLSLGVGETFILCDGTHDDQRSRRIVIFRGRVRVDVDLPPVGTCP